MAASPCWRWWQSTTSRSCSSRRSIEPYPGSADDLGPQFELRLDELVGFGDRQLHQGAAAFLELLLQFCRSNPRLLAQAPKNLRWRAGRCEQTDPGFDAEAGEAGLGYGRQIGHFGVALGRQQRDAAHPPRRYVKQNGGH